LSSKFYLVGDEKELIYLTHSIVMVHRLQGHPKKTWTKPNVRVKHESWTGGKYHKEYVIEDVYWPHDLLLRDCQEARILVYGYDSNVSRFFQGKAHSWG
jgi:hypothetical protein